MSDEWMQRASKEEADAAYAQCDKDVSIPDFLAEEFQRKSHGGVSQTTSAESNYWHAIAADQRGLVEAAEGRIRELEQALRDLGKIPAVDFYNGNALIKASEIIAKAREENHDVND